MFLSLVGLLQWLQIVKCIFCINHFISTMYKYVRENRFKSFLHLMGSSVLLIFHVLKQGLCFDATMRDVFFF